MVLYYIYIVCLFMSTFVAFLYRKQLRNRQLHIFIPYLFLVSLQELLIHLYTERFPEATTGLVYNLYKPFTVIFLSTFYYRIPFNAPLRKLISCLVAVYVTVTIVTFSFIQSIFIYNSYLSLAGGLVITCCGIFFLFNYFNLDNRAMEKHWRPVIWVTIGIVVFYPVVNISFSFYKHLVAMNAEIMGIKLYNLIPRLMSIFMYGCFIYSFYLCKKKN